MRRCVPQRGRQTSLVEQRELKDVDEAAAPPAVALALERSSSPWLPLAGRQLPWRVLEGARNARAVQLR
jgi:hypothetical protein